MESSLKIGKKAFLLSVCIILALMLLSGVLTRILPAGEFEREKIDGRTLVVEGSWQEIERPHYPIWRWFTSPVEILWSDGNVALITIIIFILCVGGSIAILDHSGIMKELIAILVRRFSKKKYLLIWLLIFFFMFITSFIGVYEGLVPMIVFIVPLAISLGFDSLTGLGISLLPMAFGFSAAVTNPFTIAIAQRIAELPTFSGALFRIAFFITIYFLLGVFVSRYAKKIEKNPHLSLSYAEDEKIRLGQSAENYKDLKPSEQQAIKKGLICFASCVGLALLLVFITARLPGLSDLAFPVMGLLFLIGGFGAGHLSGFNGKKLVTAFFQGARDLFPGVILILMAYSVKHIIVSGKIMDSILHASALLIGGASPLLAAFLVYATTLVMNFFIGSASAKAFLMMPLLTPLADLVGISRQTAVLAFNFGDGFSNMIFPTNALLLIALSFTVVSYPKWMRWTWKLQLMVLVLTSVFLAIAVAIKYGPF